MARLSGVFIDYTLASIIISTVHSNSALRKPLIKAYNRPRS